MKVWIVFVKHYYDSSLKARYIDSQWAVRKSAVSRKEELEAGCKVWGCLREARISGVEIDITEASVVDVAIAEPPQGGAGEERK